VTEGGGDLSLGFALSSCTADNGKVYPYTGSLINTWGKFQFTYGFLEARIYAPTNASGQLINSLSFWADGTGNWPTTGELDVMELLDGCGPAGSAGFSYHFHSPSGGPGACVASASTGGWHTFGADWEPGRVTYYYDGKDVGSITNGITGAPMYLILSHSASVYGSQILASAQARVDYVRVWQKSS
jgi:beta-glucanase (GH16 family)